MTSISEGDIVQVVLDVVHVQGTAHGGVPTGHEFERVLFQGVFPQGAKLPPPVAGAERNVLSGFFGTDMRSVSAFLIQTDIAEDETR